MPHSTPTVAKTGLGRLGRLGPRCSERYRPCCAAPGRDCIQGLESQLESHQGPRRDRRSAVPVGPNRAPQQEPPDYYCAGCSAWSDPLQTFGLAAQWVFLRHTPRAGRSRLDSSLQEGGRGRRRRPFASPPPSNGPWTPSFPMGAKSAPTGNLENRAGRGSPPAPTAIIILIIIQIRKTQCRSQTAAAGVETGSGSDDPWATAPSSRRTLDGAVEIAVRLQGERVERGDRLANLGQLHRRRPLGHQHGRRRRRGPLVEHPLGRGQTLHIAADDDHLDEAAGQGERRPQRRVLPAPRVQRTLGLVGRLRKDERRPSPVERQRQPARENRASASRPRPGRRGRGSMSFSILFATAKI